MKKLDEREIIRILTSTIGIQDLDDVSSVDKNTVMKCDMLVARTDVPELMHPWQVARKSMVSCASDLAAKGAKPLAAMVSLGIPGNCTRPYVEGLAHGFTRASKEFEVKIVGGDTNEASDLVIDCCMIGTLTGKMPTRKGARHGDVVVLSGLFGLAPAGLAIITQNAKSSGGFRNRAITSVLEPLPRQRFGEALAKYFSSSIDSSDGLATSLYELAINSKVDLLIETLPAVPELDIFARQNGIDAEELIFHGGEEYEIVATIPPSKLSRARSAARKADLEFHVIGKVRKGNGKVYSRKKLIENRGYLHFSRR